MRFAPLLTAAFLTALSASPAAASRARRAAPAPQTAQVRLFNAPTQAWGAAISVFQNTAKFRGLGVKALKPAELAPLIGQLEEKGMTAKEALSRLTAEPQAYAEAEKAARERLSSMADAALGLSDDGDSMRDKAGMVKELLIYKRLLPDHAERLSAASKSLEAQLKKLRKEAEARVQVNVSQRAAILTEAAEEPAPVAAEAPEPAVEPIAAAEPAPRKQWTDDTSRAKALLADLEAAKERDARKAIALELESIVADGTRLETSMTILDGLWRQQPQLGDSDPDTVYDALEAVTSRLGARAISEESARRIRLHAERSLAVPGAAPGAAESRARQAAARALIPAEEAAGFAPAPPAAAARTPLLEQGSAAFDEHPGTAAALALVGAFALAISIFVALWSGSQAGYFTALAAAPALYYGSLKSLWHRHAWTGYSLAIAISLLALSAAKAVSLGHWSALALAPAMLAASWLTARSAARHEPEIAVVANILAAAAGALAFLALGPLPILG